MKATINQAKLKEIKAAAVAVLPNTPLKGQAEVATLLRDKGFSIRAISRFLGEHGAPVSTTAITHYFRQKDTAK